MANKIEIGWTADDKLVSLDIPVFLRTRMLVQAASGQGKSHWLRRLCELLYGEVQIFVIDHEGEFATLRKGGAYDFVIAGEGGDTGLDVRSAALLLNRLLELNASTVFDLSDAFRKHPGDRKAWVRAFLSAMMEAPKRLQHPVVVIVDEAHKFAPEKDEAESSEAMISLATDGRKRQFCAVYATQRLGKLSKDAASELLNVMIGGTVLDIDRKRAADALGVYGPELRPFNEEIKSIPRGNFWCQGQAISRDRVLCKVGPTVTSPPKIGSSAALAAPPASNKIKAMLPKLEDLPKAAADKAATEADLRNKIAELEREKRKLLSAEPVTIATYPAAAPAKRQKLTADQVATAIHPHLEKIKGGMGEALQRFQDNFNQHVGRNFILVPAQLRDLTNMLNKYSEPDPSLPSVSERVRAEGTAHPAPLPNQATIRKAIEHIREAQRLPSWPRETETIIASVEGLSSTQSRILRSLAELEAAKQLKPRREAVAFWSAASPTSSAFERHLSHLNKNRLIQYPDGGHVALTEEGRDLIGRVPAPRIQDIYDRGIATILATEQKLFKAIYENYPTAHTREAFAEAAGEKPTSSAFERKLSHLKSAGLIEYPGKGTVKASSWLFLE